jgi:NitT/TauT family transport system substrate-binding protein
MPRAGRFPEPFRRRVALGVLLALGIGIAGLRPAAAERPALRVGTLSFGTADWEIDVIRRNKLDEKHGFRLVTLKLADKDAASIALLSGGVDVIVSDWLWVSHQRRRGGDVCFVAHSLAVGGLMVPPGSSLHSVADLRGRRIGVGGGPDDKSWLLLQAYARKSAGLDLAQAAYVNFSAPPLLNHLALAGKLDAVVNFWQFDARLEAAGFRELLPVTAILPALGIDRPPPLLGWVFHQRWAEAHPALIEGFLAASAEAKQRLRSSDAEWAALRPLMGAGSDDKLFAALRDAYRRGIPPAASPADAEAARRAFAVMVETAGPQIVGGDTALAEGTFWPGPSP